MTEPLFFSSPHAPVSCLLQNCDSSILLLALYKSSCQGVLGPISSVSVGLWKISSLSLLPLDQRRACPSPLHVGLENSCRAGLPQPSSLGQKAISRPPPTQHSPPLLQMKGQGLSLLPGTRWLEQKGISIVLYMPDQFVFWLQFYRM